MTDIVQRAKRLLENTTPGPWEWVGYDIEQTFEAGGAMVMDVNCENANYGWIEPIVITPEDEDLIAAAPELAKFVSGLSSEFTVEWLDKGRWRPVVMEGLDGTFANIRAARGYAAASPYDFNRIVHRFVGETEVVK